MRTRDGEIVWQTRWPVFAGEAYQQAYSSTRRTSS